MGDLCCDERHGVDMDGDTYRTICESGHEVELDLDALAEVLEDQRCPEDGCDAEITSIEPEDVCVECVHCGGWEETCNWRDAAVWLYASECPRCRSNTETAGDIRLVGTHGHSVAIYTGFGPYLMSKEFLRKERPDYWELVTHFTSRKGFLAITETETIVAAPTGYFRVPAVCLTDAPVSCGAEFRRRYGDFGITFRKSDLLRAGGGPALYMSDRYVQAQTRHGGFSEDVKPFVNVLRIPSTAPSRKQAKKVDYLHDREWRFPGDLGFSTVSPVAVVLPEGTDAIRFAGRDGRTLLDIVWRYKEFRG